MKLIIYRITIIVLGTVCLRIVTGSRKWTIGQYILLLVAIILISLGVST